MNGSPRVTALMVNRNHGRFIGEAITSVAAQSCEDWELVIVDNGSTDHSWEMIRGWSEKEARIRAIRLERAVEIPAARNMGLAHARGEYVATIDSDDVWVASRLSRQLEVMEAKDEVGVCGANVWVIDQSGRECGLKTFPASHAACLEALWYRNPFCHSATLVRRSCFARCGRYDESFGPVEDLELWFRIGIEFRFENLSEPLARYRVWRGNATSRQYRRMVRQTLRVRRLAAGRYGYRMGWRGQLALAATWCAQFVPPRLARGLFERCVLGRTAPAPGLSWAKQARTGVEMGLRCW